jgi:hypothetical protein
MDEFSNNQSTIERNKSFGLKVFVLAFARERELSQLQLSAQLRIFWVSDTGGLVISMESLSLSSLKDRRDGKSSKTRSLQHLMEEG